MRTASMIHALADRLCRPQHIGLFGHRGVGKTTLLTMLYREAVSGRLPELRLAAGDAATANYLADKVLQLESGAVLPATLAETDLHFQLYHHGTRLELVVKDYQGEHVAVGRAEPIRDFLRECDAVWLCFDPALLASFADRLHGEQEAEQVIEDYLALDRTDCPHRPMALVLTKSDLLPPRPEGVLEEVWLTVLARDSFGMTLHALKRHAPDNALFAVSSLGRRESSHGLTPRNLDRPLLWLVEALRAQDEARLDRLFQLGLGKIRVLERCVRCFAQRYPDSPRVAEFEERLRVARRRRLRNRALTAAAVMTVLLLGFWLWDTIRFRQATTVDQLEQYVASPLSIGSRRESAEQRLREENERLREQKRAQALASLRKRTTDPFIRSTVVLRELQQLRDDFPDTPDLDKLSGEVRKLVEPIRAREAQAALDDLSKTETVTTGVKDSEAARKHLEDLVSRADRAATEFADTPLAPKLRERRSGYIQRVDEHDFELARAYSRSEPLNFATRRERYQQYLSRHPQGGFATRAREAIAEVETAWDKHDFRVVRDLYVKKPQEFQELVARSERYLAVHDRGRYRVAAKELIAWVDRVNRPRDYTVKVIKGDFSKKLGRWYTKGPDLSVSIEVNGVKHGPTQIKKNDYDPYWDYEFPRYVTWKPGDTVRIIIRDHDYWGRPVLDHSSDDDDKLAMRLLSGKFEFDEHAVWFESDFNMPVLPKVD